MSFAKTTLELKKLISQDDQGTIGELCLQRSFTFSVYSCCSSAVMKPWPLKISPYANN